MDQADLVELCGLFHTCEREKEAMEALRELVEYDPVFDVAKRRLFHTIYKSHMDSLRSVLELCQIYRDNEVGQGKDRHVAMLEEKREKNFERLLNCVKEGVELIDNSLLPNAADTEATVAFQRMKGDFYRYVAEHSDESESITAAANAEEAYREAVSLADQFLPKFSQLRMELMLSVAVFKHEIKKEASAASDMLKSIIEEFDVEKEKLSDPEIFAVREIIDIMKHNLEVWMCA